MRHCRQSRMKSMSLSALIPVQEYLGLSDKPAHEYRDGVLSSKAMPTKLHALIQYLLIDALRKKGVEALGELTVKLSEHKYLVPDVVAAAHLESPYPVEPVLLCCEILSPEVFFGEDRLGSTLAKCEEYHAWGVPYCWVLDPVKQAAWEYHAGGEPIRVAADGSLRAGELWLSVAELFSAS